MKKADVKSQISKITHEAKWVKVQKIMLSKVEKQKLISSMVKNNLYDFQKKSEDNLFKMVHITVLNQVLC